MSQKVRIYLSSTICYYFYMSKSIRDYIVKITFVSLLACMTAAKEGMQTNDRLEQCGLNFLLAAGVQFPSEAPGMIS